MSQPQQDTTTLGTLAARWLFGQPFTNVLLVAHLACVAWIAYYGITQAIPAHLKAIQEGYLTIEEHHSAERKYTLEMFDKWFGGRPNKSDLRGNSDDNDEPDAPASTGP